MASTNSHTDTTDTTDTTTHDLLVVADHMMTSWMKFVLFVTIGLPLWLGVVLLVIGGGLYVWLR